MTATERAVKIEEALGRWASLEWVKAGIEGRAAIDALRAALAVVPEPPTLASRFATPGFRDKVEKARALLDAKDQGWNEGVEAAALECDNGRTLGVRGNAQDAVQVAANRIRALLIPTVPPSKEKP